MKLAFAAALLAVAEAYHHYGGKSYVKSYSSGDYGKSYSYDYGKSYSYKPTPTVYVR